VNGRSPAQVKPATRAPEDAVPRGAAHARPNSTVLFELPPAQGASLGRWLSCAAVAAEVGANGVLIDARANRVFGFADLARLVREWMQAHRVDAVFANSDGAIFSITSLTSEAGR
jgi:hypothetical protein